MTRFQLFIYLSEVEMQCEFSLAAAHAVDDYFKDRGEPKRAELNASRGYEESDPARLFRSLHSLLTHAAVVSRLLWPSIPRRRAKEGAESLEARKAQAVRRGEEVRRALGVTEGQPEGQRTLRDHLEHFDERLDDWALTSRHQNIIDCCVGPPGLVFGAEHRDVMRWYDQTDGSFYFRGEQFDVRGLVSWINDVRDRAASARRYGTL